MEVLILILNAAKMFHAKYLVQLRCYYDIGMEFEHAKIFVTSSKVHVGGLALMHAKSDFGLGKFSFHMLLVITPI